MNNSDSKQTDLDDDKIDRFAELEYELNEVKAQSMLVGYMFIGVIVLFAICLYCYMTHK